MSYIHGADKKEIRKKNISVFGRCKSGFTLIEIVVVIGVIGILMSVVFTQIQAPGQAPVDAFTNDLYTVVKNAQLSSLSSHRTHRIVLDFQEQYVYIERATDERDAGGNLQFEPTQAQWQDRAEIPHELEFTAVYVNGADELAGGVTERIWIYCYPSGILQQTRIMVRDTNAQKQYTIYINPVTADVQVV